MQNSRTAGAGVSPGSILRRAACGPRLRTTSTRPSLSRRTTAATTKSTSATGRLARRSGCRRSGGRRDAPAAGHFALEVGRAAPPDPQDRVAYPAVGVPRGTGARRTAAAWSVPPAGDDRPRQPLRDDGEVPPLVDRKCHCLHTRPGCRICRRRRCRHVGARDEDQQSPSVSRRRLSPPAADPRPSRRRRACLLRPGAATGRRSPRVPGGRWPCRTQRGRRARVPDGATGRPGPRAARGNRPMTPPAGRRWQVPRPARRPRRRDGAVEETAGEASSRADLVIEGDDLRPVGVRARAQGVHGVDRRGRYGQAPHRRQPLTHQSVPLAHGPTSHEPRSCSARVTSSPVDDTRAGVAPR